ncbi:hypothetical protein JOF53_007297 [Crossiella equi]|uniref:Uncharacterized protein n=1 Tax=Crossiella equi TaxID=130796 RepID=A0ABS5APB9_9PSEU|nr:hypothetical protein [Crossiella equi]MBP2478425.1 hypothetical protein [Crossiella equi]
MDTKRIGAVLAATALTLGTLASPATAAASRDCKNIGNGELCVEVVKFYSVAKVSYRKTAGAPYRGELVLWDYDGWQRAGSTATWYVGSYFSQEFHTDFMHSCITAGIHEPPAGDNIWGGRLCF